MTCATLVSRNGLQVGSPMSCVSPESHLGPCGGGSGSMMRVGWVGPGAIFDALLPRRELVLAISEAEGTSRVQGQAL